MASEESPKRARASPPLPAGGKSKFQLDSASSPARGRIHGYDCNSVLKVTAFIKAGGKVNASVDGFLGHSMPPLHWACFYQNTECVALLLEAGADASLPGGPKKKTALEVAHERACPPALIKLLPSA